MKVTLRIPTIEYGFVEIDVERETDFEPHYVAEAYKEYADAFKAQEGVTVREFRDALDHYLKTGEGNTEFYHKMSRAQQSCFKEIQLANARINRIKDKSLEERDESL
jgi:hypothetical protein